MEPNIPVGSLVFSKPVDPALLAVGDVIVYKSGKRGDAPITHRVVSHDTAKLLIITKGDANEREDVYPLTYDKVISIVKLHVPRVGFVTAMMTSVLGKIFTGLVLIEAWLLMEIGCRLQK